jgi:hypothetical protein
VIYAKNKKNCTIDFTLIKATLQYIKFITMSKEKDIKKKSDKTVATKTAKEKRVDKLAKRKEKDTTSRI